MPARVIAEGRAELELLRWTRAVNKTYGTQYSFDQMQELLQDDFRADALRADLEMLAKERE